MKTLSVGSISIGPAAYLGAGITLILLVGGILLSLAFWKNRQGSNVLTDSFSEPLGDALTAKVDIDTIDGNLTIDGLDNSTQLLASGILQYLENQGLPMRSVNKSDGQVDFTVKAGGKGQPWFRLPWQTCNGATDWQVFLNPSLPTDISLKSGGGNVRLDLAGMAITRVFADTGGGNMEVTLPDHAADLNVTARTGGGNVTIEIGDGITGNNLVDAHSGAGNVVVLLPKGVAARILATSGMGKVQMDSAFVKLDEKTYQSPDYENAADKFEITLHSGAGNVIVNTR